MPPLTDLAIRRAKPTAKTQRLYDSDGLHLELSPKGGRWFRLKYRFGGKEKRLALGVYPEVPLALARQRRDEARQLVAQGIDPGEHRKAATAARADHFSIANRFRPGYLVTPWSIKFQDRSSVRKVDDVGH
ncbi:Arm DNA-binding domain-containing protein [Xanthomonas arboricola]|uniref:Arm DNA-binding domain-containing protein n=1 Tax=Xanthomonas arboricola TaxID=56448 RepID=UPI0017B00FC8|nr:Arm DNA-binding domain-containing protein [Xanthomonas arboricola]MBB6573549.1 hypothetical protein [Xanthomonas arboricola]